MIIKKEVKNIEHVTIDTIKLKNLDQFIKIQKTKPHTGVYFFKIFESDAVTYFIKLSFHKKEIKQEEPKEIKLNILQSQFLLNQKETNTNREQHEHEGVIEASVVFFRENEFIEFTKETQMLENMDVLIRQLENKVCFEDSTRQQLNINYRTAAADDYNGANEEIIKNIFKGDLTEYTIEEIFENRHKIEIFNISKIPVEVEEEDAEVEEPKYHIVYELKNQYLISKDEIDKITIQSLEKSTSKFLRIDNIDLFKEFFRLEKIA